MAIKSQIKGRGFCNTPNVIAISRLGGEHYASHFRLWVAVVGGAAY
jgi:hypothetical protein